KVVVVGGDLDLAGRLLPHRMVAAVVAELELVGLAAQRQPDQLVPEADAEDGHAAQEPANALHRIRARLRIAGAIREKHAVRLQRQHFRRWRLGRHHLHPATVGGELAQDVALDAEVVRDHPRAGRGARPRVRDFRGHNPRQVGALHVRYGLRPGLQCRGLAGAHDAALGAALAQMTHQRAGVNLGQYRNSVPFEVGLAILLAAPVAGDARELAHDQPLDVRPRRLVVLRSGAVVADLRRRETDDLAAVGGVGADLLVSGHRGVEDHLARALDRRTERAAAEPAAIFQYQLGLHRPPLSVDFDPGAGLRRWIKL